MFGAEAVELGEQPREVVGGDARTVVGDRDTDAAILTGMIAQASRTRTVLCPATRSSGPSIALIYTEGVTGVTDSITSAGVPPL